MRKGLPIPDEGKTQFNLITSHQLEEALIVFAALYT